MTATSVPPSSAVPARSAAGGAAPGPAGRAYGSTPPASPTSSSVPSPLTCERVAALGADGAAVLGVIDYGAPGAEQSRCLAAGPDRAIAAGLPLLHGAAGHIDVWRSIAPATAGATGAVRWRSAGGWLCGWLALDEAAGEAGAGLEALAHRAYRDVFAALDAAGHPHLLRLWNYLPSIHADEAGLERYRRFNLGRQRAFLEAGRAVSGSAPAACALGTRGGPLRVAFLAGRTAPLAIENPRQVAAWRYPPAYGPASPTFSRAALADAGGGRLALFVSGTASIVGHASVHAGQVEAQTRETLANLEAVAAAAQASCTAPFTAAALTPVVYVRHAADAPRVRAVLDAVLGAGSTAARQAVVVQADVCRGELLVEIEAHALLPGRLPAAAETTAEAIAGQARPHAGGSGSGSNGSSDRGGESGNDGGGDGRSGDNAPDETEPPCG